VIKTDCNNYCGISLLANMYRLLVGRAEGKRPLGRQRHRWVDNINVDLAGIGWGGMVWIGLAQEREKWYALVNAVMNLRAPQNAGKLPSGYTTSGLLSSVQLHIVSYHCYQLHTKLYKISLSLG
jgi:hypothetical protein